MKIMKISHIAIWTAHLERSKAFYCKWFGAIAENKYINSKTGFESYFLKFENSQCGLEIMTNKHLQEKNPNYQIGLAHFAISVGSNEIVDSMTFTLKENGYGIKSEPRTTGDGFYESVVADPDGNLVEITV